MTKTCYLCNTEKELNQFGKHKKYKDGCRNYCLDCAKKENEEVNIRYGSTYKRYLQEHGCYACGFNNPDALEVHHLAKEFKRYNRTSQSRTHNLQDIAKEEAIILCANCHLLFHAYHGGRKAKFPLYTKDETKMIILKHRGAL